MPRTAAPGVTKSGIFASLKSGFTSSRLAALRASSRERVSSIRASGPSFTASTVAFAASTEEASAVGTFITSTASVFPSLHHRVYRSAIAIGAGIADDVDRVAVGPRRGQRGIERIERFLLQMRERAVQIGKRIGGQDARPAAIRDNGKAAAGHAFHARDHLSRFEHFMQVENAQDARAAKRCTEDVIRAGQRAGVRKGRFRSLGMAAGLDRDHRLRARAAARRRHELRRLRNSFDIKENRPAHDLARQIVQHVAKIHVGGIADRDDMAKSQRLPPRPIEHRSRQRSRLRYERDIAAAWQRFARSSHRASGTGT